MDDINGIPLMWNDDEDLFRSIRQKADNNFLAAKMNKSVEEISVFNNSPFSGTSNLVKAFAFQNLRPEEVHSNRFQGIKPQQSGPIQMIQDPGCDCGLVPKVTPVYLETNKKSGYQPGEDRLVGNIWVFTSTDKAKLAACYKEIGMPKPDQAFLFYFNRKGAEKGILQAKLGTDLVNKVKLSLDLMEKNQMDFFKNFDQDGNILVGFLKKQTLASDYPLLNGIVNVIGELIANAAGFVSNIIGMGCSYIGKLLQDHLTIPEHVWDSEHGNYTFKSLKEADLLPKKEALLQALQIDDKRMGGIADGMAAFTKTVRVVRQNYMVAQMQMGLATVKNMVMQYNAFIQVALDELYDTLDAQKNVKRYVTGFIANICGIWNGVLDFVAGVFVFLGMVGETPYDFWSDLTLDTFVDYAQSIYRFFSSGLGNLISAAWESTRKLWNDVQRDGIEAINTDKVVYSVAFTTIFIGTFFIPGLEGAHASKALKFVKGLMPERFLEELAVQTGKLNKLGNKVGAASKTLLDDFTKLAAQGKSALSKFFDDICEKIRKWFLKAKEKAQQALSKTRFTQELKDLGGIYRSKLARVLSRHYDDVPTGVKTVEKVIAEQEYEFAAIFRNGKLEGKLISSGKEGSVMFEDALLAKMKNAVVTHNHPTGASLSPADIKLFLKVGMKEVRAKCPDGSVFSLKNKGVRLGNKEADNIIKKIKNELEISYGGISDKIIKQRFEADLLMKELKSRFGDKIDYIHYK